GLCLPVAVDDPRVGLPAIAWYAWISLRLLFSGAEGRPRAWSWSTVPGLLASSELSLNALFVLLASMAIGNQLGESEWVMLSVLGCGVLAAGVSIPVEAATWRTGPRTAWLVAPWAGFFAGLWLGGLTPSGFVTALAMRQGVALLRDVLRIGRSEQLIGHLIGKPAQLFVLSFAVVIAVGAGLLSFPVSSATGRPIPPLDALFTSTSAVCVTGLTTLDTATAFSTFGKLTILLLIQVGGLGVITLSSFAVLVLSQRLGLRLEGALGELVDQPRPRELRILLRLIVLSTVGIEAFGAFALWPAFEATDLTSLQALWKAVFHSISAFCNAGFALQTDNLMSYQRRPFILLIVSALILTGGLGFPVLGALGQSLQRRRPMSIHARIGLVMAAGMTVVGFLLFVTLEWSHSLGHLSVGHKLTNSLLHAVTLRTAGFNSLAMTGLRPESIAWMIAWMFIGGGSGGTAGGIKTTTVAVLMLRTRALLRGRDVTEVWSRHIPHAIVERAAVVALLALLFLGCGHFLLLATQGATFHGLLFEAVSAMGTVGLSLDVTPTLDGFGKLVIIGLMFVGRIGPLTLLLVLRTSAPSRVKMPAESIPVG
ncbi:MAG: hypothetical protein MUF54_12680, partial [Polyangiaceae bacterium]|nr:hypothetical protein [Polyangiaceae bacterium]